MTQPRLVTTTTLTRQQLSITFTLCIFLYSVHGIFLWRFPYCKFSCTILFGTKQFSATSNSLPLIFFSFFFHLYSCWTNSLVSSLLGILENCCSQRALQMSHGIQSELNGCGWSWIFLLRSTILLLLLLLSTNNCNAIFE
jgi:hypothetical protein